MIGKSNIVILVALVFIAGGVSGFFLGARVQYEKHRKLAEKQLSVEQEVPVSSEDRIMSWLVGYLGLSDAQESEIRPLLRLALKEHKALELEQESRVDALIDRSDIRIAKHLSAEQAEKLFEHNRQRRQQRDEHRARKKAGTVDDSP